jgi:glycosyltransferase involved in cell wall biosynthesis
MVVPCRNEEKNLENFVNKAETLFKDKYNFKILFIDDGSSDETWNLIKSLNKKFIYVKGIRLTRNFGKENAINCGIQHAEDNDFIIIIDADLQHPMEKIDEMISLWCKGNKIVSTYKVLLKYKNFRYLMTKIFYFFLNKFLEFKTKPNMTDFTLLDKEIVKKYNAINESNKQFRFLLGWLGYRKIELPIQINQRNFDKTKFNLFNLSKFAIDIISSFSLFPFKIIGYLSLIMIFSNLILLIFFILNKIFFKNSFLIGNYAILVIIQIILTGLILLCVSILAIYLKPILNNSLSRPSYIIEEKTN